MAQGVVDVTLDSLGMGDTGLIPFALPAAGRIDVSVDWKSFANKAGFFVWEGACAQKPCPGRLVIEVQAGTAKPRRQSAEGLAAGEYTLQCFAVGTGRETLGYEVLFTPN